MKISNRHMEIIATIFVTVWITLFSSQIIYAKEDAVVKKEAVFRKQPAYSGFGTIDRAEKDFVVVNDKQYPLTEGYAKRTSDDESIANEALKKGMKIGYMLNEKKEIEVIWILPDKDPD